MKKQFLQFTIVVTITLVAAFSFSASRSYAQSVKTEAKPTVHDMVLHVNGMMCHDCEHKVEASLKKIRGVSDVHANYAKGTVSLHTVETVPQNQLLAAVKKAGFSATVKKAASTAPKPVD